jgi:aryl-alcohol dehydrogenase-like predicted oxidoreductase
LLSGKIRAIGVSNFSPGQMDRFGMVATLSTMQPPYNLFERGVEHDVLPHAFDHGITSLTYGALCRGLLSGRITAETKFSGDDLRKADPKFRESHLSQYVRAVSRLDDLARQRFGKRVIHLALRWVLDRRGVGAALWGARRPDQLDPLPDVFDFKLDKQTETEIDEIVREEVPFSIGPEFMAPPLEAMA